MHFAFLITFTPIPFIFCSSLLSLNIINILILVCTFAQNVELKLNRGN